MENWLAVTSSGSETTIAISGRWRLAALPQIAAALGKLSLPKGAAVTIRGENLEEMDTAGALLFLRFILDAGIDPSKAALYGFPDKLRSLLELVNEKLPPKAPVSRYRPPTLLEKIGKATLDLIKILFELSAFIGRAVIEGGLTLARPRRLRIRELFAQLEYVCLDAIPIVMLVTFLIGVVVSYLFGIQIEKYGANIFIVDGVALAMCRELSPILVAVIVAGRSGSAFTAQIGAMKINEEVDALDVLSLSPFRVLVLPRVLALMIAMPLLVFIGDITGILGGMLIADLQLDVTGATFLQRLQVVLTERSFLVGLIKAPAFAAFIGLIGCQLGLSVENNARSLGEHTTATVVRGIVSVILLNAGFAILFSKLKI